MLCQLLAIVRRCLVWADLGLIITWSEVRVLPGPPVNVSEAHVVEESNRQIGIRLLKVLRVARRLDCARISSEITSGTLGIKGSCSPEASG